MEIETLELRQTADNRHFAYRLSHFCRKIIIVLV